MTDKDLLRKRLLAKVKIDPTTLCFEGVCALPFGSKSVSAPRLAAYAFGLFDLEPQLNVCHHCDNCGCINPSHLFIGSDKDNARDCLIKNRRGQGFRCGMDEWPFIPVLFNQSLFIRASGVTHEYGLKKITDLIEIALDSIVLKLPRKKR